MDADLEGRLPMLILRTTIMGYQ